MAMVSSSSASVAVEKATSDLLINPDWTVNIDICDSINSSHWAAKDVVKAVKKRLQHKSPRVQLLTLTLLETMVKNCGDFVHFQIAEKNILGEMVKIVKKKTDMHVRDKILVLLDSWQEAFGGPGGKHPQYYWAYEELRRSGVEFPQRSLDTSPIFTPPANHPASRPAQAGYGMPINASRRLDETMASDIEGLSLSSLESMRNIMELLSDMLQAVSPDDREAVKDEIIIDLVNRCRSNQKMLMQMLTTTGDEELLSRGLELNDSLQVLLAKHDAIASGSPMPAQVTNTSPKPSNAVSDSKPAEESKDSNPTASTNVTAPVANVTRGHLDEEEEEDDFAMLARRHSKSQPGSSPSADGNNMALVPMDSNNTASSSSNVVQSNALALPDPPATLRTTKEQDMIEFLSLTLANTSTSPKSNPPSTPPANSQNVQQATISSATQGHVSNSYGYDANQGQVPYTNYVVPWAQPPSQQQVQPSSQPQQQFQGQPQPQQQYHTQAQTQPQTQSQQQFQTQPQTQQQFYNQPQTQPQTQSQQQIQTQPQTQQQFYNQPQTQFQPPSQQHFQAQPQAQLHPQHQQQFHTHPQTQLQPQSHQQFQAQNQSQLQPQPHQQFQSQPQTLPRPLPQQRFQPQSQQQLQAHQQPQLTNQYPQYSSGYPPPPWAPTPNYANGKYVNANPNASYNAMHETKPSQHMSFPRLNNASSMNGDPLMSSGPRNVAPAAGQRTYIPSRLFEDLNVLGSADGRFKAANGTSQSLSGSSGPSMVGGRK